MATKTEAMLAGTPAKLARMLASDDPGMVAPAGTTQANATPLLGNFVLLYGATAEHQGVRLRPATGQFLHAIYNCDPHTTFVYPDGTEAINALGLSAPFGLVGGQGLLLIPAQRQWTAIGGGAGGAVPVLEV
jgi:hypothetical protein